MSSILIQDIKDRDTLAKSLKIGVLPNEGYLMKQKLDTKTDLKFLSDLQPNESMVDRFTTKGQGAMAIKEFTYRNANLKTEQF